MDIFKIDLDIYKCDLLFIFNCSVDEANKYLMKINNKYIIEKDEINMSGRLIRCNYETYRIMYLREMDFNNVFDLGMLAHELFHLVVRISKDKGITIESNIQTGECGDEASAYLMEHLTIKVIQELQRIKNLKNLKKRKNQVLCKNRKNIVSKRKNDV